MAYTIVKSDGTVLTTIADGTINTTSTSVGLPGRNYAGYGQTLDTNFVHQIENFAASTPPANPLRGQLWYNINNQTLYVCPTDGATNANAWLALTSTASGGTTTFGNVTVTGNLQANNISAVNAIVGDTITVRLATVTANATIANAEITTANIGTTITRSITTGGGTTTGTLTGTWTATGGASGNTFIVTNGNLVATTGIKTDNYFYANGDPFNPVGQYSNSNVATYLPTYGGIVGSSNAAATFRGSVLTTGANTTAGTITGNWTLTTGSRLNATYADLAERFESDKPYEPGTVVELGGEKEITAVKSELSPNVFGVISETAGYLMNSAAGDDNTHPPVAIGGRVKVKVIGTVEKNQRLVSAGNGLARAALSNETNAFNVIGRSLVDKKTTGIGVVEAFVRIN